MRLNIIERRIVIYRREVYGEELKMRGGGVGGSKGVKRLRGGNL